MPPSQSTAQIREGQIWQHHSTGLYKVYRLNGDGSVAIRPVEHDGAGIASDGGVNGVKVWQSYLRANFTLYEEHA